MPHTCSIRSVTSALLTLELSKLCLQSCHTLGLAVGTVSPVVAGEVGSQHATEQQLGCLGRRPTETLSEQVVAVPVAAVAAHQEPPLLPPQRPEHKVGFTSSQEQQHCYHYTSICMKHDVG